MKLLVFSLILIIPWLAACGKTPAVAMHAANHGTSRPVLTKEEVAAILGSPVTSVEGAGADMGYKTDVIGLEATIDIETTEDAVGAINGARKATGMLGGTADD